MIFSKQCDHCGQSFMQSALQVHIKEVSETKQAMASDIEVEVMGGVDEDTATSDTEVM
jgi:uncharacterized radical SAM superfamily protein